jgi:transketolase
MLSDLDLKKFAIDIRKQTMRCIHSLGKGHVGGSLSIADLLAVLYGGLMRIDPANPNWEDRDYLVVSKGHAGPAVYASLALKGFFPMEWLDTLNQPSTRLPSHCDRNMTPGIDATTGSLGQGLPIAAGLAHALKIRGKGQLVFCITGDGEQNEGLIWEAVLYAANHKLDNLINFVDLNKRQIDGYTHEVLDMGSLDAKYTAFGWYAATVKGDDPSAILNAVDEAIRADNKKPIALILDTIKGQGVPFIEEIDYNHSMAVSDELYERAIAHLDSVLADLETEL